MPSASHPRRPKASYREQEKVKVAGKKGQRKSGEKARSPCRMVLTTPVQTALWKLPSDWAEKYPLCYSAQLAGSRFACSNTNSSQKLVSLSYLFSLLSCLQFVSMPKLRDQLLSQQK